MARKSSSKRKANTTDAVNQAKRNRPHTFSFIKNATGDYDKSDLVLQYLWHQDRPWDQFRGPNPASKDDNVDQIVPQPGENLENTGGDGRRSLWNRAQACLIPSFDAQLSVSRCMRVAYMNLIQSFRYISRPRVKPGHQRLEFTCDCGDDLYADLAESDLESLHQLRATLNCQDGKNGRTMHPSDISKSLPMLSNPQTTSSQQPQTTSSQQPEPSGQSRESNPAPKQMADAPHTNEQQSFEDLRINFTNTALGQAKKRFVELCVNTGEFQRQLAEIDVSDVENDSQLFNRIKERYLDVRGFRVNYFLLKPVDVHFVQFSLEDRYRVGILDKPMAIPSQEEMVSEGYGYYPCPLKPPPIPANIFLHYLSHRRPHNRLIWGKRIPQKLHKSILQMQSTDELVVGWGVHIIEGLNKFTMLMATLVMLLVSGIVSVTWTIVRNDVQGGFGIGAWLTSVQAVILMMVLAKWNEL